MTSAKTTVLHSHRQCLSVQSNKTMDLLTDYSCNQTSSGQIRSRWWTVWPHKVKYYMNERALFTNVWRQWRVLINTYFSFRITKNKDSKLVNALCKPLWHVKKRSYYMKHWLRYYRLTNCFMTSNPPNVLPLSNVYTAFHLKYWKWNYYTTKYKRNCSKYAAEDNCNLLFWGYSLEPCDLFQLIMFS